MTAQAVTLEQQGTFGTISERPLQARAQKGPGDEDESFWLGWVHLPGLVSPVTQALLTVSPELIYRGLLG